MCLHSDEKKDRIAIPCDDSTLAILRVITKGDLDDQQSPIPIFIQVDPPYVSEITNGEGNNYSKMMCSGCKKELTTGFLYKCLECRHDENLCYRCYWAGRHPEHIIVRCNENQVKKTIKN